MKPQLRIQIPEPCHQPWQEMPEVETGKRHCGACNRTLTDFSQWSDAQLIHFFTHTNDKFCGRFSASQLNRNIIPAKSEKRLWPKLFLPAFLFAATVSAQQVPRATTSRPQIVEQRKFQIRISGFVLLADSLKGAGAGITLNNGNDTIHAVSDANGHFAITMNAGVNDTLHACVSLPGFNRQYSTIVVAEGQLNYVLNVRMQEVVVVEHTAEVVVHEERHYTGIPVQYDVVVEVKKHKRIRHFFHRLFHPFKHKHN